MAVQALGVPTLEKVANPVFSLAGRDLEGVPGLGQLALVGKGCCLEGYGSVTGAIPISRRGGLRPKAGAWEIADGTGGG